MQEPKIDRKLEISDQLRLLEEQYYHMYYQFWATYCPPRYKLSREDLKLERATFECNQLAIDFDYYGLKTALEENDSTLFGITVNVRLESPRPYYPNYFPNLNIETLTELYNLASQGKALEYILYKLISQNLDLNSLSSSFYNYISPFYQSLYPKIEQLRLEIKRDYDD